ncbi:132 kDa protein [Durusdinium trenchii]|uniref:132 kDa protein n=1 Tax=Durusdinium trenchii TaxID=1381693 RepID=A0ABP0P7W5_9DINO
MDRRSTTNSRRIDQGSIVGLFNTFLIHQFHCAFFLPGVTLKAAKVVGSEALGLSERFLKHREQGVKPRCDFSVTSIDTAVVDGHVLRGSLLLPKGLEGPFPSVLLRTPYGRKAEMGQSVLAKQGYAVLVQDTRGRFSSSGEFVPMITQSNIRSAVFRPGGAVSFELVVLWFYLVLHLMKDLGRDRWSFVRKLWQGIREEKLRKAFKSLPMGKVDEIILGSPNSFLQAGLSAHGDASSGFWEGKEKLCNFEKPIPPCHILTGWYDFFLEGALEDFQMALRRGSHVSLTDSENCMTGKGQVFEKTMLSTFDEHLKGDLRWHGQSQEDPGQRPLSMVSASAEEHHDRRVHLYVLGLGWRHYRSYPPLTVMESWHLGSSFDLRRTSQEVNHSFLESGTPQIGAAGLTRRRLLLTPLPLAGWCARCWGALVLMPAATLDGPVRPLSELMWMCTSLALWPERSQRPGLQPVALRLLRACGGFARLLHTTRCCPPSGQKSALVQFDTLVQRCFSSFTGIHCSVQQWAQATRGLPLAGLGLRSTSTHSPAAYLVSVGACLQQCCDLDPTYPADLTASPDVLDAMRLFNACLDAGQHLSAAAALTRQQQDLSRLLDKAGWDAQMAAASAVERTSLVSEGELGGRAFLAAIPHGSRQMESALFVAELRLRLQVADAAEDTWCPKCDAVLDTHSHHAAVCLAGGERTQRRHAVRDLISSWAERVGLRPEKEKPGLLLPQHPDDHRSCQRRPADIFIPVFNGAPTAFDIAVTASQRLDTLAEAGHVAAAAATAYTEVKRKHLNTAELCAAQNVRFQPLVAETTGVWSPEAARVLRQVARTAALRSGDDVGLAQANLFQEACILIRGIVPVRPFAAALSG